MNTNDPVVLPYIGEALKINDALLGLPALPLVLIGCIVAGYMCKLLPVMPNKWIPAAVFLFGILANVGIQPPSDFGDGVRSLILGMVAGGASIIIHRKFLKNWIDINVFETGETKQFTKPPIAPVILLCLLPVFAFTTGCAWFHPEKIKPVAVAPGQDSFLVNAERIHKSSLSVYHELKEWEMVNRDVLPLEASRAVDKARLEFPAAWQEADLILKDYRKNRGDPTDVNRIAAVLAAAQASMLRLKLDAGQSSDLFSALNLLSESIATLKAP